MKLLITLKGCAYLSALLALTSAFTLNGQPSINSLQSSLFRSENHRFNRLQATAADEELNEGISRAWRSVPKPLLRIGGKGIAKSHGNSLRELLNAHTVVKVKINSTKLGSLEDAFETIKKVVEESQEFKGVELIHIRKSENTIMLGKAGTMDEIREGTFPSE